MGENSKIEWTDHTFNPWIGCSKVHAGCQFCYAERDMDNRLGKAKWGPQGTRVLTGDANWRKPLKWNREAEAAGVRKRVFCASLADIFEDWQGVMRGKGGGYLHHADKWHRSQGGSTYIELSDIAIGKSRVTMADVRARLFSLIDATPWLDWLLLTKRPENVRRMLGIQQIGDDHELIPMSAFRKNVWLGTSISTQEHADKQIPELLKCRDLAPVLFVSAEPLLGEINITRLGDGRFASPGVDGLDWVIAGGESGPDARPMHPMWARSLRDQCQAAGVPYFMKQMGGVRDKRGDEQSIPKDLWFREFPDAT